MCFYYRKKYTAGFLVTAHKRLSEVNSGISVSSVYNHPSICKCIMFFFTILYLMKQTFDCINSL